MVPGVGTALGPAPALRPTGRLGGFSALADSAANGTFLVSMSKRFSAPQGTVFVSFFFFSAPWMDNVPIIVACAAIAAPGSSVQGQGSGPHPRLATAERQLPLKVVQVVRYWVLRALGTCGAGWVGCRGEQCLGTIFAGLELSTDMSTFALRKVCIYSFCTCWSLLTHERWYQGGTHKRAAARP